MDKIRALCTIPWLCATVLLASCGGGSTTADPDQGTPPADLGPLTGLPVGSQCTTNAECSGPGNAECIVGEYSPLEQHAMSPSASVASLVNVTVIPFPDNYCSNTVPCTNDAQCGIDGACFQPLVDVDQALFDGLIDTFTGDPNTGMELDAAANADLKAFREFGICLQPCSSDADCTRPGYVCDIPIGNLVGILDGSGARLETYCVGDPCDICDANATCDRLSDPICSCNTGFTGDGTSCLPEDPCGSNPCQNSGTCTEDSSAANGYVCTCPVGFSGDNCETAVTDCSGNPCVNGAAPQPRRHAGLHVHL